MSAIGSSVWVRLPSQTSLRRAMAAFKLRAFYTPYRTQLPDVSHSTLGQRIKP